MVRKRQTEREEAAMAQELRHSVHRTVVSATQHAALADKMQKWEKEKHQKREQKQRQHNISMQRVHKRKVSAETVVNRLYVKPASSDKPEPVVQPAWGDGLRPETNKPHLTHVERRSSRFHFSTTNRSQPPPLPKTGTKIPDVVHPHHTPPPSTEVECPTWRQIEVQAELYVAVNLHEQSKSNQVAQVSVRDPGLDHLIQTEAQQLHNA